MNFKLFGKTILIANTKFGLFWAVHSASESRSWMTFLEPRRVRALHQVQELFVARTDRNATVENI